MRRAERWVGPKAQWLVALRAVSWVSPRVEWTVVEKGDLTVVSLAASLAKSSVDQRAETRAASWVVWRAGWRVAHLDGLMADH